VVLLSIGAINSLFPLRQHPILRIYNGRRRRRVKSPPRDADTSDILSAAPTPMLCNCTFKECGKNCVSRLEGGRTVLSGKVLFLCNACALEGRPRNEKPAATKSGATETAVTRAA
jgi:hypothetical protein